MDIRAKISIMIRTGVLSAAPLQVLPGFLLVELTEGSTRPLIPVLDLVLRGDPRSVLCPFS